MSRSRQTSDGFPRSSDGGFTKTDVDSLVVAHYAAELGMSYDSIKAVTGFSRTTISKRLQNAKDRNWLEQRLIFHLPQGLPEDVRLQYEDQVYDLQLQQLLVEALGTFGLRSATVVSDREALRPESYEVSQRVGQAAAARLSNLLSNRRGVVGVNWGYSTLFTVRSLAPQRKNADLVFFPLMGNFSVNQRETKYYAESRQCSSNRLARLAAEAFEGAEQPLVLTTPSVITRKFAGDSNSLNTIWEMIEDDYSYRAVFGAGHHRPGTRRVQSQGQPDIAGPGEPLIRQADTIITGISGLNADSALVSIARLVSEPELVTLREAGMVGDVGGHPIADPSAEVTDPKALEIATMLDNLLVSPLKQDFIDVANRARLDKSGKTGVFMIGRGPKGAALVAAAKMGAVNEIFTDRATARDMLRILEVPLPQESE